MIVKLYFLLDAVARLVVSPICNKVNPHWNLTSGTFLSERFGHENISMAILEERLTVSVDVH